MRRSLRAQSPAVDGEGGAAAMTRCHGWLCPHGHSPALPGATFSHGIQVKVISIHGCHVAPSSQRSHLAVMVALSGLTGSVDRTIPPASAVEGRATAASSPHR
jgi:hypothetical protein